MEKPNHDIGLNEEPVRNGYVFIYKLMSQSSILWAIFLIQNYTNNLSGCSKYVFFWFVGQINI